MRYGEFDNLTSLGDIGLDNQPWEFYLLGVWRDEAGMYYLGTDSGCSCPIPWENYTRDALTGPLTLEQAREETLSLVEGAGGYGMDEATNFWADQSAFRQNKESK